MTERLVEVIAKGIAADRGEYPPDSGTFDDARAALAALRDAGFEIFRPDDCEGVTVDSCDYEHEGCRRVNHQYVPDSPPGIYRLVPVGGEG